MMRIKFQSVPVLRRDSGRFPGNPLNSAQLALSELQGLDYMFDGVCRGQPA